MERTVRDALVNALENLNGKAFKKFYNKLHDWNVDKSYNKIPKGKLEKVDPDDVVNLIQSFYLDSYGAELTVAVLNAINEKKVAEDLKEDLADVKKKQSSYQDGSTKLKSRSSDPRPDILESTSERSSVEDDKGMRISYYGRHALTCSICLDIYTDPVTLSCGHSFCIQCITRTWSEQFEGESTCPHCRMRFKRKPDLKKNLSLSELADCYRSIEPASEADKSN